MERIAIVDCGGSGKSRFARVLAVRLGITPVHFDALYYAKDWKPLDQETFASLQRELVTAPVDHRRELRLHPADPSGGRRHSDLP